MHYQTLSALVRIARWARHRQGSPAETRMRGGIVREFSGHCVNPKYPGRIAPSEGVVAIKIDLSVDYTLALWICLPLVLWGNPDGTES